MNPKSYSQMRYLFFDVGPKAKGISAKTHRTADFGALLERPRHDLGNLPRLIICYSWLDVANFLLSKWNKIGRVS